MERPMVLTVAGFDPSAGAGLAADLKTMEAHGVYGLGVQTALTVQNDSAFRAVRWTEWSDLRDQVRLLGEKYPVHVAKIGLIESLPVLQRLLRLLHETFPDLHVIWDPILKASAGFEFHDDLESGLVPGILEDLFLCTPNRDEVPILAGEEGHPESLAEELSRFCPVLLKGGHKGGNDVTDILMHRGKNRYFAGERLPHPKHGTGCVLSSAIASRLALGDDLPEACRHAKAYVRRFLESGSTRLGFHAPEL